MVESIRFILRASARSGRPVARAEFIDRLSIEPGDPIIDRSSGSGALRIELLSVAMKTFAQAEGDDELDDDYEPSEAFAAALHEGIVRAAAWLARQPVHVFEELRANGRETDVFVGGWIEHDQFDLDLPPEFLRACGRLGLRLSICTND